MRGEGLETVGWSERGWGVVALPFQRVHLVYSKTNYDKVTKYDKTSLPQGTRLSTPGDRLHKHRQAFPWHPSRSTRGQTTNMTDKSSHGTHFKVNHETDYTTHKAFPWHPSQSTRGQTTNMTDKSSHGTHFKVNHETDYTTHKAFPWHSSQSIQGDRLHRDGQNLPLESF